MEMIVRIILTFVFQDFKNFPISLETFPEKIINCFQTICKTNLYFLIFLRVL
ncbi:hypothetical protein LEP1GSC173_4222 [Leptospira interrogans str. HAI1594]|uniref:Uncharacterized protein n=7 Tax=Leptospira TaxID=171 RepID=M6ZRD8_LEPIR|nr:hypothetical protein LEP1GSC014_2885 [Leptospira interrogans serovar Pomona str. Pomona]EKO16001.1 hypothetical protein LEP1GSC081_4178 [Leptospira kirschneri str. H1]EKO27043.1 hypothetical protein LEP1GSC104_0929 [Leptospira interrogans str. UI 12621]EKO60863.1 hypothetical protein LEP1GSC082_0762 [Leptospira kirschneri str. H2]EKP24420.1 hypothetical protein LEP1GSC117_1522 [Leptospira interrogans serovar Icterohaemorrhagiae str. Verdun LP]EKP74327.1 hypothetical protein LEP1GSC173_4222 